MKKGIPLLTCFFLLVIFSIPCPAQDKSYRIEVLQVTGIEPFQSAYKGFIQELQKNGIIQGKNLQIRRTIIDFDVDKAGLWEKNLVSS